MKKFFFFWFAYLFAFGETNANGFHWTASALGILPNGTDQTININIAVAAHPNSTIWFESQNNADYLVNGTVNLGNTILRFEQKNKLVGKGTINGGIIDAGFHLHIFSPTLTLVKVKPANGYFSVKWFGANSNYPGSGTGVDASAAINRTLGLLNANLGSPNLNIIIPEGNYWIANELVTPNSASWFTLSGNGMNNTNIYWGRTLNGGDMLRLVNPQRVIVKNISFIGKTNGGKPDRIINVHRTENKNGDVGFVADCFFENIAAHGNLGTYKDGLCYTSSGANNSMSDQNNEQGTIQNCYFELAERYGISFEHQNALWHRISGGRISAYTACINNVRDDGSSGGGFELYGTTVMHLAKTTICFKLTGSQYPISIVNAKSEGTGGQILVTRNSKENLPLNVTMSLCNWKVGTLSPGTDHFEIQGTGSKVTLNNCSFFSSNGVTAKVLQSIFIINGGNGNLNRISYSGKVFIDYYHSDAVLNRSTFYDLGGGEIHIGPNNQKNLSDVGHDGRVVNGTINVTGLRLLELELPAPAQINSITGGYPGQEVTLFAGSDNITIGTKPTNILLPGGNKIILSKHSMIRFIKMGPAFGGYWAILN